MRKLFTTLLGGAAVALAGVAGCGPTEEPMFPVEGAIQHQGKPLLQGTVILFPDAAKGNGSKHEPRGAVVNGRFKVTTHPREGAPPGWYKLGVVATEPSDPTNPYSEPRSLIPERFGKPDESKLSIEVRKDAAPTAYDLDLK